MLFTWIFQRLKRSLHTSGALWPKNEPFLLAWTDAQTMVIVKYNPIILPPKHRNVVAVPPGTGAGYATSTQRLALEICPTPHRRMQAGNDAEASEKKDCHLWISLSHFRGLLAHSRISNFPSLSEIRTPLKR